MLVCPRLFVLLSAIFSQIISAQSLSEKIDKLINQQLPHATVAVLIKDASTNQIIYRNNADKLLSPASGMKLYIAAAALYQLKPDYKFATSISQKNQNIYLTFGGSPAFTSSHLTDLLLQLKKNNIDTINGDIVLDSSRFKAPYYTGGVSYDDLGWYYSAPDTAAVLNENAVDYDFISAKELGMPVQIKPKTKNKLTIINEVVTVSKEQAKDHCNLNIEIKKNNTLRLYGCFAQESKSKAMKFSVPDPILLIKNEIKKTLDDNGIILKGKIISGTTPSDARPLATKYSDDLSILVGHMLQESDNLYANNLTKQLAYSLTGDGTYKQGIFAVKKILAQHTNLDLTQIEFSDGMGTRYNLVTAEQMTVLLKDIYNDKNMQTIFINALPQSGTSGSLKERMKKTNLEKIVFAKTGTMHDISSLSGYMFSPNSNPLIFSIIINGINVPINNAKALEEKILLTVNNYLKIKT